MSSSWKTNRSFFPFGWPHRRVLSFNWVAPMPSSVNQFAICYHFRIGWERFFSGLFPFVSAFRRFRIDSVRPECSFPFVKQPAPRRLVPIHQRQIPTVPSSFSALFLVLFILRCTCIILRHQMSFIQGRRLLRRGKRRSATCTAHFVWFS